MEDTVKVNSKEIPLTQLEEEKKKLESAKGVKLVKIKENEYKTRLED